MVKDFALDDLVWAKMKGFPPWPARISQPPDGSSAKSKKPQHFVYFFGTHDVAWILDELIVPHSEEMLTNSNNYKKKSINLQAAIEEIKEESLKATPQPKKSVKEKSKEDSLKVTPQPKMSVKEKSKEESLKATPQPKKPVKEKSKEESLKATPQPKKPVKEKSKEESLKATPQPKKPVTEKSKKETPCHKSPELNSITGTLKTGKKEKPHSRSPQLDTTQGASKKSLPKRKIEKKTPKKGLAPDNDQGSNSSKTDDYSLLVANVPPNNALAHVAIIPPYDCQVPLASFVEPSSLAATSNKPMPKKLPSKKKLGFIGLGVMGSQMVRNLLNLKNNVTVWNRSIGKCDEFVRLGARKAETPADLVRACDIIFCCVSNAEAVKSFFFSEGGVVEGFSRGGSRNKAYVEMTSIDPTTSQEMSEAICGAGGSYLEAPMIGSRQQLKDSAIVIVGAGDRNLFNECETCFNVWATHVFYLGRDVGSASKMNLLLSMVLGTTYAAVAEALALVEKCGLPPELFMKSLEDGPLNCPLVMNKAQAMLQENAVVDHPLKHIQKDLDMAVALSNNCDQPLQVTVAVNEQFKRTKREFPEGDVAAVRKCYKFV